MLGALNHQLRNGRPYLSAVQDCVDARPIHVAVDSLENPNLGGQLVNCSTSNFVFVDRAQLDEGTNYVSVFLQSRHFFAQVAKKKRTDGAGGSTLSVVPCGEIDLEMESPFAECGPRQGASGTTRP